MDGSKQVYESNGSMFSGNGSRDPEELLAKAQLMSEIADIICRMGLTPTEAARILGITEPRMAALIDGKVHEFSTDALFRYLNALGRDVEIVVKFPGSSSGPARVTVTAA